MTASIALNSLADYDGGGTLIEALTRTGGGIQDLQASGHSCALRVERGHAVVHPGCIRHGGERITRGLRYVLILFLFDASLVDHDRYCLLRANVSQPCEETRPWLALLTTLSFACCVAGAARQGLAHHVWIGVPCRASARRHRRLPRGHRPRAGRGQRLHVRPPRGARVALGSA